MNRLSLSIRNILLLAVGTLTLIITLMAGYEAITDWQQIKKIQSLREATILSDRLFDATEKFSVERDVAFIMLHATDSDIIRNLRIRIKETRNISDEAFTIILHSFTRYEFSELVKLKEKIKLRLENIRELRSLIDVAMEQPTAERKELADNWYGEATALTQETEELWLQFIGHFSDINPVVTQHLRFKNFLRIISNYTGRQRSIIGRLLVENADPTIKESSELLRGQGAIELSWKMSGQFADQSGLMPSIASYYTDARSHYLTMTDMMRDIFYVPGAQHGVSYPIDINLWFELSDQYAESLDTLKDVAFKETQSYVVMLEMRTWRAISLHALLLLGALGLCGYSCWLIARRVIMPINNMVGALVSAMEGKPVALISPINRNDEIGKLAQVLHVFQKNMEVIRQTSAELKQSHERYQALVEASAQIVWTWKQGALDKLSPLSRWWEATTGQPAEKIATFGWLEVVHPDDRDNVRRIWEDAMSKGRNFEMDYRLLARSGEYLHVAVRGVALLSPDGSVSEFIGSLNDITARKQAEHALKVYMEALERSNKELDDFAYIASHDLKEPLRGIHNHSCFLLEDNESRLDEESVRKLNRLVYLSKRMELLVNDLLYFSRLGRQDLAIKQTNINDIIHDVEDTLDVFLSERQAQVIIPSPLPTIICDKTRVTELFRNLITNAVKYNDKPEKTVEIGFLDTHPSPQGIIYNNVFYVKDNGKGIATEFHEEVFRIFKRLQSNKNSKEEGTGVGLTFVKKIVERHGGKIWLESDLGRKTIFYFTLEEKKL